MNKQARTMAEKMSELIEEGLIEQPEEEPDLSVVGWWRISAPIFTSYDTGWAEDTDGGTTDYAQLERRSKGNKQSPSSAESG